MAAKKTSAELAREEAEANQLDNMLGNAFGDVGGIVLLLLKKLKLLPNKQK